MSGMASQIFRAAQRVVLAVVLCRSIAAVASFLNELQLLYSSFLGCVSGNLKLICQTAHSQFQYMDSLSEVNA